MKGNRNVRKLAALLVIAVMAVMALAPTPAVGARDPNPGVIPPQAHPYGHTYGEWSNMWWIWALTLPVDLGNLNLHPVLDTTGAHCGVGQSGPVWFLAGNFIGGQPYTRYCHVPAGKALFIPISNWEDDTGWLEGWTRDDVNNWVTNMFNAADTNDMYFEVDGRPLAHLADYAARPEDNPGYENLMVPNYPDPILSGEQFVEGVQDPWGVGGPFYMKTAGYYVMLAPLSAGEHTIHFTAGTWQDMTYHLTIGR